MPGHLGNADAQFVKPSASLYTMLSVAQSAKCSYVANVAYVFILTLHSLWSLFWYTSRLKGLSHLVQSCLFYRSCMPKDSARSTGHVDHFFSNEILRSLQEINA